MTTTAGAGAGRDPWGARETAGATRGADGVGAGAAPAGRGWHGVGGRVGGRPDRQEARAETRRAVEEQRRAEGSCCLSSQPAECPQNLVGSTRRRRRRRASAGAARQRRRRRARGRGKGRRGGKGSPLAGKEGAAAGRPWRRRRLRRETLTWLGYHVRYSEQ
jgi:hypothetical protein